MPYYLEDTGENNKVSMYTLRQGYFSTVHKELTLGNLLLG